MMFSPKPPRGSKPRYLVPSTPLMPAAPAVGIEPVRDDEAAMDELAESLRQRGWYDSSRELRHGLDVIEDLPMDLLPDELKAGFFTRQR